MANKVLLHAKFATLDSSVQAHSVAFASMIGAALQGVPLDHSMKEFLYQQPGRSLPFSSILSATDYDPTYGHYTEPDSLLWFGSIAQGVKQFKESIHPAHRGVLLYGQFCAFFASIPSAYYCAARFPDNFEDAVLCSVNGGGQNTMRTSLVGALLGARVGLSNIPSRFLIGLEDSEYLIDLAGQVADAALERSSPHDEWFWPTDSEVNFTIGGPGYHHTKPMPRKQTKHEPSSNVMIQNQIAPSSLDWRLDTLEVFLFVFLVGATALAIFSSWTRLVGTKRFCTGDASYRYIP